MKRLRQAREFVERLLRSPTGELDRASRFLRSQIDLWRFCARRLRENNLLAMSSALSFRTIFAMIPVLVLALLIAKATGVLGDSDRDLRHALDAAGLSKMAMPTDAPPAQSQPDVEAEPDATASRPSKTVADWIVDLVKGVERKMTLGRIGPVGVLLLVWTSLTLLTTVERSLNRIFEAPADRALGKNILLYWSALTLAPVVVSGAVYGANSVAAALGGVPVLGVAVAVAGWVGHFVVAVLVLAAIYTLMPNTRVDFRWAAGGAIVAVPLWMVARYAFSLYVRHVVAAGSLYGALAMLPLFLMWLNACWQIFLFGAQVAYTGANLSVMRARELADRILLGPADLLAVMIAVGRRFVGGGGPETLAGLLEATGLPETLLVRMLDHLAEQGMVVESQTEAGRGYVLARPPEQIPFAAITRLAPDAGAGQTLDRLPRDLRDQVQHALTRPQAALESYSLADMLT